MRPHPPRLAAWMASRRVPLEEREFLLGDLEEEFADVVWPARGPVRARLWYWRQALRCLLTRQPSSARTPRARRPMNLLQDVRFALRVLRRVPGFTITAVLTLALGIGATTAIFSVVHAVLLAPLPFATGDRLVVVRDGATARDSFPSSNEEFQEWRQDAALEATAAWFSWDASLTGMGEAEPVQGLRVSSSFFSAVSVTPTLGTTFTLADESRSAEPKVVIGTGLWRRHFGAHPDAIGRRIVLNDVTFTIVGVLPAGFRLRPEDPPAEVVVPLRLNDTVAPPSLHFLTVVGLLRPGQRIEQARDQLQASLQRRHPEIKPAPTATVIRVRDQLAANSQSILLALLGAVLLLLLIACANLANLQLARASDRRQEFAVRLALGAAPGRLLRQLLTENLVLSAIGGALGVALAWIGVTLAKDVLAVREAGAYDVRVSLPVFAFASITSVLAGVLVGLAPALAAGRRSLRTAIGDSARVAQARPLRASLVAIEVALALVLLVGACLLTRSLHNLVHVDKGFDGDRVLSFAIVLPDARYPSDGARTQFYHSALEGLARLPGVSSVGFANERPFDGSGVNGTVPIEGRTFPPGRSPNPEKRIVSPDYFRALGIRVLAGRTFSERDTRGAPPVMVVSASFARKYFGTLDAAIGQRAGFNWDMGGVQQIVGVVSDVKHYGLDDGDVPMVYVSYLQRPIDAGFFVLKTAGEAGPLAASARAVIRGLDHDRPVTLETLDGSIAESLAPRRFALVLVGGFAALGLLLSVGGIYGVASYLARQRTREFGIRVALGAVSGDLTRLVLRQGMVPIAVGLVCGGLGARALTGVIRAQLFGIEPTDPVTFLVVGAALALVALAASTWPAVRAGRVDPVKALRAD